MASTSTMEKEQEQKDPSHNSASSFASRILTETNEERELRIGETTRTAIEAMDAISSDKRLEEIYIQVQSIDCRLGGDEGLVHEEKPRVASSDFRSVVDEILEEGNNRVVIHVDPTTIRPRQGSAEGNEGSGGETGATGSPASSTWTAQEWIDVFVALQTSSAVYAVATSLTFIGFGAFGTKSLSDADACDGGTDFSAKVISYAICALVFLWVSLFLTFPATTGIRGMTEEHLKRMKKILKRAFVMTSIVLMLGIIFMGLATFYFVQVRLGAWGCSSSQSHGVLLFVGLGLCFLELIIVRSIYYVLRG